MQQTKATHREKAKSSSRRKIYDEVSKGAHPTQQPQALTTRHLCHAMQRFIPQPTKTMHVHSVTFHNQDHAYLFTTTEKATQRGRFILIQSKATQILKKSQRAQVGGTYMIKIAMVHI